MNKNYLIALFALVCNFAMAQIQQTSYRGAFAPSPTAMWTTGWTNFDPQNAAYPATTVTISSDITSNTSWTAGNVYLLQGLITVRNGATLTIAPGTTIRSAQTASALLIARGAKLIANGTAALPIVFTSNRDRGERQRGDWGGIVMLGKARYNINNGVNFIEGITQTAITEFGGGTSPDNNDNSGILRFVRIEYAGYVFAPNNELNGLTMGAVGKGTVIENVQVSYSLDDSFEWFGGSVNCKNLVAFAGLDDDFDVDNGYSGVVQYGLSVKDPLAADVSTSETFEVDNNNSNNGNGAATDTVTNTWADYTSGIFTNFTAIGPNKRPNGAGTTVAPNALHSRALRLRKFSRVNVFNSIFVDHKTGVSIESLGSNAAYQDGDAKFKNNTISAATPFATSNTTSSTIPTTAQITATIGGANTLTTSATTSTGILAATYNGTDATNYKLLGEAVTATSTATGVIDYRPSSSTGADFTDSKLSGLLVLGNAPGVTSPLQYCKGVVAPALTANLTATGVSLRWYTSAATPTSTTAFTTVNPVPATSATGSKSYFVREVDANGAVSNVATIVVTVDAAPLVALGSITSTVTVGGAAATAAVGNYIGTATQLTYTVPASTETGVTNYLWTVPTGANIKSGQGTNTIAVDYLNVPAGTLKVGNVSVQARNASFCGGAIKTLAITAVLPAAPAAIKMTDLPIPSTGIATAVTSFAKYMGTATPLTLVATPVVGAQSYIWELPTGVNITRESSVTSTVDTKYYVLFPFIAPVSNPGLTVNTSGVTVTNTNGSVYYEITTTTYTDGTSVATGKIKRNSRNATTGVGALPAITAFELPLTDKTFLTETLVSNAPTSPITYSGVTINPAYPITSSTSNVLNVNFNGVTFANSNNYTTSAGKSTNIIRIGVKAKNGVGVSLTANAATVAPIPTLAASTAKLLTLTAVAPAAPAAIKMTNNAVSTITAVTDVSKFVGTSTVFTLTATASVLATSYTWELPAGVNLKSGALTGSSSNVITVDFENVAAATTAVYIGVKAVNGIASSSTVNVAPNAASTAKLLKLTAAIPAAVGTVTGQITLLCGNSSYNYTITASPLATSYAITAPTGSVVTSANNLTNTSNVLTTSDLAFTVQYNGLVSTALAKQHIAIAAKNGVGTSHTYKILTLTTTTAGCPGGAKIAAPKATVSATEVYPNPVSSEFNIDVTAATAGVLEIAIYSLDNNLVVSPKTVKLQKGANTISENVSSLNKGIYIVRLVNSSTGEVITKKLVKN